MQALLNLDISFNCFESAAVLAHQLAILPELRSLCVAGNPLCLQHHYAQILLEGLLRLFRLDGREVTGTAAAVQHGASEGAQGSQNIGCDGTSECDVRLDVSNLHVQLAQEAASHAPPAASAGQAVPPTRPDVYYVEVSTFSGVRVASTAKRYGAPADPPAPVKGGADKGKGKGKAAPAPTELPPAIPEGQLTVHMRLPCTVAARDWLQTGVELQLWQVVQTAVQDNPPEEQKGARPDPKGNGKTGVALYAHVECLSRSRSLLDRSASQ